MVHFVVEPTFEMSEIELRMAVWVLKKPFSKILIYIANNQYCICSDIGQCQYTLWTDIVLANMSILYIDSNP